MHAPLPLVLHRRSDDFGEVDLLEAPSETVVGCYNTLAFSPIAGRYLGFTFFVALHDERTLIR